MCDSLLETGAPLSIFPIPERKRVRE